jgi:hypothetical protein
LSVQLYGTVQVVHVYHTCSHWLVFAFWCSSK